MSPLIEISSQTFARLQKHAVPLIDNIESVINRFIDHYEGQTGTPVSTVPGSDQQPNIRQFISVSPPDLTHTKILAIEFKGKPFEQGRMNWGSLLLAAIREAKSIAKSVSEFKRLVLVNFVEREKKDDGYKFYSDIGLSIQGQDSNYAWKGVYHIAQTLGLQVQVTFAWREKDGAAFPGIIGQFSIPARRL